MPSFSIQLSSNRPRNIQGLLDNIEATADAPEGVEVLVHIDTGDAATENLLKAEQQSRRVLVRYLQTDLVKGFPDIWKVYNPLFRLTSPDVYFVTLISDEMRFDTRSWDTLLMQYAGYYPDDIFRLRGSQFRFRNYTDFWQCGFAPDSLAFYTRKWLSIQGDWNPCGGPDSFQQCVAFYMFTYDPFSPRQFNRDIAVPHIRFGGEGVSVGMSEAAREKRLRENNRAWFVLMSHRMQEEASRRAMLLNCHIISYLHGGEAKNEITDDKENKIIILRNKENGGMVEALPYRLSRIRVTLTNLWRAPLLHYYCGGGNAALHQPKLSGIRMVLNVYFPAGTVLLRLLETFYTKMRQGVRKIKSTATVRKSLGFLRR
jgi:hypothetical protein